MSSILIIKLEQLGDAIMVTGLIRDLKSKFPNAFIDIVAGEWSKAVFETNPNIRYILSSNAPWWCARVGKSINLFSYFCGYLRLLRKLRRMHYDLVIEARGDIRHKLLYAWACGARRRIGFARQGGNALLTDVADFDPSKHEILKMADLLGVMGIEVRTFRPELYVTAAEELWFKRLKALHAMGSYFVVHPGAKPVNRWPISGYVETIRYIHRQTTLQVVVTGSHAERALTRPIVEQCPEVLDLTGETSFLQLAKLIEESVAVLSGDTSVMHIAAAFNVPSFVIFGPTTYERFGSLYPNCIPIQSPMHCTDRLHETCSVAGKREGYCMRSVTWEMVAGALLGNSRIQEFRAV